MKLPSNSEYKTDSLKYPITYDLGSIATRVALDIVERAAIRKIWHNDERFVVQNIPTKEFWRCEVKLFD